MIAKGQFWRSMDSRDLLRNRRVEVEAFSDEFVFVRSHLAGRLGVRSRIHRSRFDGKQFQLISGPGAGA